MEQTTTEDRHLAPVAEPSPANVVNIEDYAMTVAGVLKQVNLIQEVMTKVMREGEHYGTIPGTKKKTLLKSGAEKLCLTFRLEPNYEIIREVRDTDFLAYTVRCILTHIPTGTKIATGIGSCNSREARYRYRHIEESTGEPIPKAYWAAKEQGESKEMKRLLGGDGFRAAKIDGQWVIARSIKVENDNPWDLDNTIIKMGCKRSLTAAILNATAASDIFTQDVEDLPKELLGNGNGHSEPGAKPKETSKGKTPKEKALELLRQNITKAGIDEIELAKMAGKDKIEDLTVKGIEAMNANWAKTVGKFLFKQQGKDKEAPPKTESKEGQKSESGDKPPVDFVIPATCIHDVMKDMVGKTLDPAFCAAQPCHKECKAYQDWENPQPAQGEMLE